VERLAKQSKGITGTKNKEGLLTELRRRVLPVKVEILHFRPFVKNSLQGFVTVFSLRSGLRSGCTLHELPESGGGTTGKLMSRSEVNRLILHCTFPAQNLGSLSACGYSALDKFLRKNTREFKMSIEGSSNARILC